MKDTVIWTKPTRFLHFGLVITVTFQLLISLVMAEPEEGKVRSVLESLSFEAHEAVGLAALAVVLLHWIWSFLSKDNGNVSHLFPWGSEGRAQVMSDIRLLMKKELPEGGGKGGLPGLIHGLGLLAVTAMAVTGAVIFVTMPEDGMSKSASVEIVHTAHEVISNFVWAYWIGHVATAVMHKKMGHDTVQRMFNFK